MVQTKNKNLEVVKKYSKRLQKSFDIDLFIFFGSRARGNFNEDSDFDLIIVSKDFEDRPWHKRPIKAYLKWTENYPLEILCYTPKEFETMKKKSRIIQEAVKEGIEIK